MGKSLFIAEKPSVAREFGKALKENLKNHNGYMESENCVVTWCVGHLITMSYPESYDENLKRWRLETLPFIPDKYLYEVIGERESIYIDLLSRRLMLRVRQGKGYGLIPRLKRRLSGESRRPRICLTMTICLNLHIFEQKKII